jgi:hypothetical protein
LLPNGECIFISAGGFDDECRDQARFAFNNSTAASGDHEEADTKVWLHNIPSSLFTVLTLMYILLAYHLSKPQIKLYLYN